MGFPKMTTHKELLAFRDDAGEVLLVDAAPVSAVELVQDQSVLKAMLEDEIAVSVTGPILAVVEGGKSGDRR